MKQTVMAVMALLLVACGQSDRTPQMQQTPDKKILRTVLATSPMSLDPRHGGNRVSQVVVRMLFEGLMRIPPDGEAEPAMAKSVEVDDTGMVYTFHLRDAFWSNGEPVTAHDFVYSWKKAVDPHFDCRFAYAFFMIKNAEAAKMGDLPLDQVGVWATDDKTLVVELAHPAPYFLDHTANPILAPVPAGIDERNARWSSTPESLVCNGTFRLCEWQHDHQMVLERNAFYWDAESIAIDGVNLAIIDDMQTCLALFEQGKLDYLGEPLADLPLEALDSLRMEGNLYTQPVNGLYLYMFNCSQFPFTSAKMRRALALALDRQEMVTHLLRRDEGVATSMIPPALSLLETPPIEDGNVDKALALFSEALEELGITHEAFPEVVITYGQFEGYKVVAQAIQQRWQEIFGIPVRLEGCEYAMAFSRYVTHDYMVGSVPMFSWYEDSIYNMEWARRVNLPAWNNPVFEALLECADHELDLKKRERYLRQAEHIIMEEMPFVPIHLIHYKYVKQPGVQGPFISSKGMIDLKWARLEETQVVLN